MIKNLPADIGGVDSILGLGRSPGEENGNPLQHSCLGNSVDRGARRATDHDIAEELAMSEQLNKQQQNILDTEYCMAIKSNKVLICATASETPKTVF